MTIPFADTALTNAELEQMEAVAPHLVVRTIDNVLAPAWGIDRRAVMALEARYPSMRPGGQRPATPMAPTATRRFPATDFDPRQE